MMFDDRKGADLFRREFLDLLAHSAGLPFLMIGFFDRGSGEMTESWLTKFPNCPSHILPNLIHDLRQAISLQTSSNANTGVTETRKKTHWLSTGDYKLGVGTPVANILPIVAVVADAKSEDPIRQSMLRLAMAFVQQQLTEAVYSRSPWPNGLVEATLETLSLRFLLVGSRAEIVRDGRLDDRPAPDDPAWVVANKRLTVKCEQERTKLYDAIRAATTDERRTSIISITTNSGRMRLAVVAPLARSVPPLAMVLFEHSGTDHAALREHFFTAHGLTSSERRVAHLLLDGETLSTAAEATGLSLATVRSYLKQIFVKTNTHRQTELIALYYRSILPVGTSIAKAKQNSQNVIL